MGYLLLCFIPEHSYAWLDPIAGIIVGGFICHIGLEYLINNSIYILDGNDKELYDKYNHLRILSIVLSQ